MPRADIVAGLDIGTGKVSIVIGRPSDKKEAGLNILGFSRLECKSLGKGTITSLPDAVDTISVVVEQAQRACRHRINTVFVNIASTQIKAEFTKGRVNLDKEKEISWKDLEKASYNARASALPYDHQAIHMIPQGYTVDGEADIKNPVGLLGASLELEYFIISAPTFTVSNLVKAVNMAGLEVEDIVSTGTATAMAALTPQEKEAGAILLDIGNSLTQVTIYKDDVLKYNSILPCGVQDIIDAIVDEIKITPDHTRRILKNHGKIYSIIDADLKQELVIKDLDTIKTISKMRLSEIVESKVRNILSKVKEDLQTCHCARTLPSSIILTGGISMMDGLAEFVESALDIPVKVGSLKDLEGQHIEDMDISYMTAIGLVKWGLQKRKENRLKRRLSPNFLIRTFQSAKEFINDYF